MAHVEYLKDLGDGYFEHFNSRAGYIGPIRIPLKAALALITWEVRISHAWKKTFRPHLLHPQELTGYDGEPPYYLRADLADVPTDVVEYWLDMWYPSGDPAETEAALREMEPIDHIMIVWLVESPSPSEDPEYDDGIWYDATTRDAPGAVAYWRWDEA